MVAKSQHFDIIKHYYDNKMWSIDRVRDAVTMKWITEEEYEEITGEIWR